MAPDAVPDTADGQRARHRQRILITGASGLLGLNTALEAAGEHLVFGQVNHHLRHLTKAGLHLPGVVAAPGEHRFQVIQADLLAPGAAERLLEQTQPDWVIHCAALADVDACENDPQQAQRINTEVPRKLAQLVARGGARLLHVSTDAVFDGQRGGYTEDDAPNPLGVYARTKLEAERAVLESNPQAIVARVNLFGWSLSGRRSLAEFFFNKLNAGERCMGFTDVLFCPALANDLAHIFLTMLSAGLSGLYHAVGSECTSKYDFGQRLAQRFGLDGGLIAPASIQDGGLKASRSPNLTLQTDRLARALGEHLPNLSTGLERFYTLYQQGYPQALRRLAEGTERQ